MILDALLLQVKLFLQEDMEIQIQNTDIKNSDIDRLHLRDYTSMIGVGGKLNLMVVISYEQDLIDKLIELYLDGEEVDNEELPEVQESISGEVVNTIMGLALPTFPNRGKGVTITPPISINDASSLAKHKNSKIVTVDVATEYGLISISAIGTEDILQ